nr:immunoglobulin heavy chain junction region [Macaca mulatta]MOW20257.1 immunoglobulin heavy chain junction region [Macaca mulatta]MOW22339.1 immunoglobulin heavy chain junction region [Macaca mulatta]MOX39553.1 immunoglobulin heavy chain junction region [Macaca mulatta]
CTRGGGYFDLW